MSNGKDKTMYVTGKKQKHERSYISDISFTARTECDSSMLKHVFSAAVAVAVAVALVFEIAYF